MRLSAQANTKAKLLAGAFGAAVLAALCVGAPAASAAEPSTSQEALEQLTAAQDQCDAASSDYYQALKQYDKAVKERDTAQEKLDATKAEYTEAQENLKQLTRDTYRTGTGSFLDILVGSTSFSDFRQGLELLNIVNSDMAATIEKVRNLRDQQSEDEAVLEEKVKSAEHYADEASDSLEKAEKLVQTMQATYDKLSAEEQAYIAQQAAAEQEAAQQAAAQQEQNDQTVAAAIEQDGGTVNDDGTITDSSGNTYSSPTEYSNATGSDIVARAMSQLGADYVWGGTGGSDGGYDCSGFVSYALTGKNTRLGTTADFVNWNQVDDPQPGDVCVIHEKNGNQHTGIYIGDGKMVHAQDSEHGVVVSDVQKGMIYVRE